MHYAYLHKHSYISIQSQKQDGFSIGVSVLHLPKCLSVQLAI